MAKSKARVEQAQGGDPLHAMPVGYKPTEPSIEEIPPRRGLFGIRIRLRPPSIRPEDDAAIDKEARESIAKGNLAKMHP